MKSGLTLFFVVFVSLISYGSVDSTLVKSNRIFDQEKIESFKADPDFLYIHESQIKHWWTGISEWLINLLTEFFKDKDPAQISKIVYVVFQVLLWSILAFALAMLIYTLSKKGVFGVLGKNKQTINLSFSELESKVLETDWQELITKAIENQQYNVAVRLLFLQVLQSLNNANHIVWSKSKSIRDYQREMDIAYANDFSQLAKYYQYSWFGDVTIDQSHFDKLYREFVAFNRQTDVG